MLSGIPSWTQDLKKFSDNKQIKNWLQILITFIKIFHQFVLLDSLSHFLFFFIYNSLSLFSLLVIFCFPLQFVLQNPASSLKFYKVNEMGRVWQIELFASIFHFPVIVLTTYILAMVSRQLECTLYSEILGCSHVMNLT